MEPETIYNITIQGGTEIGYGEQIWGTWSTLSIGQSHVLRLKDRTPTTLTVKWDPVWGTAHKGYIVSFFFNFIIKENIFFSYKFFNQKFFS